MKKTVERSKRGLESTFLPRGLFCKKMGLEEIINTNSVKAMIISEFPLDSVVGTSKQCNEAKEGILKYIKKEKPDVIFVDGLCSRIRFPEAYLEEILASEPLKNLMEEPFKKASEFLKQIKDANSGSEVYYILSDADNDNIRRLTKYTAQRSIEDNEIKVQEYKGQIEEIDSERKVIQTEINKLREKGDKVPKKLREDFKKLGNKKGGLRRQLAQFRRKSLFRVPNQESPEWHGFRKQTSEAYLNKLKNLNPGINIITGNLTTEVRGYSFLYSHSFHSGSDAVLKSRTNRLVEYIDKLNISGAKLPDFILESGHNAETVAHPYRHGEKDEKYSFIFTGMVMEDQKVVKSILDGRFKPEIFQGKQNRLESCKRHIKKIPAPGISLVGRNENGFFSFLYSLDHLAKVGKGEIELEGIKFETINILSDIHVGKGAVRYDKLRAAIDKIEKEIEERISQNKTAPILMIPNESLQGSNYPTFSVETKRKIPDDLKRDLEELKNQGATIDDIIKVAAYELERTNEPRIDNQIEWYYLLTNKIVLKTLMSSEYNPGIVYNEATHIQHTVGDKGITEVGLQTIAYKVLSNSVPILEKFGIDVSKLKDIEKKFLACEEGGSGFKNFDIEIGDNLYTISSVHKPGGASPSSNIPMKQVKRTITMADKADIYISAHLHTPYFFAIGKLETNNISSFYKGATFNEYDSYGKEGGWQPAVVGYVKARVPKTKNCKGVYGVQFITSDVL